MLRKVLFSLILAMTVVGCQPTTPAAPTPAGAAFPTMTPGRVIEAHLPTVVALPLDGSGLANPATAIALASRATPTPDFGACPAPDPNAALPDAPPAATSGLVDAVTRFLSDGGGPAALQTQLAVWEMFGDGGSLRADVDLNGTASVEVIVSLKTPDEGGLLLIMGCADGRYAAQYQGVTGGETPEILNLGDMNVDGLPELVYTSRACLEDGCEYRTQIITWNQERGRFINLLGGAVSSDSAPTLEDVDQDRVAELLVRLENAGNAETGPLRTGFSIYDWNGSGYSQSITQLNPPRFRIQVLHQADGAFAAENMSEAISLYNLALSSPSLEAWRSDETPILQSYALYRLLLAQSFIEDSTILETHQSILDSYPDLNAAPVYAMMATTYWNALQVTNNLHSACLEVQAIIRERPEALNLLNRYGSRSPTYSAEALCPF